jgi:hypothetical protein
MKIAVFWGMTWCVHAKLTYRSSLLHPCSGYVDNTFWSGIFKTALTLSTGTRLRQAVTLLSRERSNSVHWIQIIFCHYQLFWHLCLIWVVELGHGNAHIMLQAYRTGMQLVHAPSLVQSQQCCCRYLFLNHRIRLGDGRVESYGCHVKQF